ncbi:MAG: hypothetical protein SGPRY_012520, partial [Prymnesium sp.]
PLRLAQRGNMLHCQKAYKEALASGKTAQMTESAKKADKASHAELNRMRSRPENSTCFDCTALKPGWAVLPHGVFVCIDCAQIHRNLGRHISQTKAINTGTYLWYPHELQVMREIGNGRAMSALHGAPPKPSRDAPLAEKESYARIKYVDGRWGPFYDVSAAATNKQEPQAEATATPTTLPPAQRQSSSKPKMEKAKRLHSDAHQDLISLDPCETPLETTSKLSESCAQICDQSVWKEGTPRSVDSGWESKKADVLSQFEKGCINQFEKMPHGNQLACSPPLFMRTSPMDASIRFGQPTSSNVVMHNPAVFFQQYGL